jgi:predicted methyltransferase
MRISVVTLLLVALLPAPPATVYAAAPADPVAAAVSSPDRSPADRERDTRDHPVDVLRFFGVTPGMTVVDLFAGGGYYSELIGRIVGDGGKVYMYNNAAFQAFAGDALKERIASGRLANVTPLNTEVGALGIPDASVDMVTMVTTYHDLYFKSDNWAVAWAVTPVTLFADINAMLKPGGVLAIVDHAAAVSSGSTAAQKLHRIDEAFARADIESRGFKFTGSIDVLHNPVDDHTKTVFDPAIQGHTDRFVYRFVKATPTPPLN